MRENEQENLKKDSADLWNEKQYTPLDEETLAGIEDKDREQAIIDHILDRIIGDNYARYDELVSWAEEP